MIIFITIYSTNYFSNDPAMTYHNITIFLANGWIANHVIPNPDELIKKVNSCKISSVHCTHLSLPLDLISIQCLVNQICNVLPMRPG